MLVAGAADARAVRVVRMVRRTDRNCMMSNVNDAECQEAEIVKLLSDCWLQKV